MSIVMVNDPVVIKLHHDGMLKISAVWRTIGMLQRQSRQSTPMHMLINVFFTSFLITQRTGRFTAVIKTAANSPNIYRRSGVKTSSGPEI